MKIIVMKTLFITCTCLLVLVACATTKRTTRMEQSPNTNQPTSELLVAQIGKPAISDPFVIEQAEISGNTLVVKVSYSGGCENHQFELVGSPNISKSLPPIRSIELVHKSNGDACKKKIEETLRFNLANLAYKQESGSVIKLNLNGWKEQLIYTFQ